jgi:hypothetical protein
MEKMNIPHKSGKKYPSLSQIRLSVSEHIFILQRKNFKQHSTTFKINVQHNN